MPTFDIQYTQRLPEVVHSPRADTHVDTGAGMFGAALANLGGAIHQIGQQYQEINNALILSKQKRRYDEINAAAYKAMDNITDEEEAKKILTQYQSDILALKTGNPWVDRNFDMHVNHTITDVMQHFADKLKKNKIRKLNDEFEITWKDILSAGDINSANELLDNMVKSGAMTNVRAESLSKSFMVDSYLQQAENQINLGDPKSLEKAGAMIDALTRQDAIELSANQLNKLDSLRTTFLSYMNRKNLEDEQIAREQEFKIFEAMEKGTLTWEMIAQADKVDPTTLKMYWNQYKAGQEQIRKEGKSVIKEGDPVARTNLLSLIDLEPDKITEKDIYNNAALVGTDHVTFLVDRLRRNREEKNPIAAKYRETLSRMLNNELLGEKDDLSTYEKYIKKISSLEEYFKQNPSATDSEALQFFSELAKQDIKKSLLARIWGGIKSWFSEEEEEEEIEEEMNIQKETGMILMKSPEGRIGFIPEENLQKALEKGYQKIQPSAEDLKKAAEKGPKKIQRKKTVFPKVINRRIKREKKPQEEPNEN